MSNQDIWFLMLNIFIKEDKRQSSKLATYMRRQCRDLCTKSTLPKPDRDLRISWRKIFHIYMKTCNQAHPCASCFLQTVASKFSIKVMSISFYPLCWIQLKLCHCTKSDIFDIFTKTLKSSENVTILLKCLVIIFFFF